MRQTGILRSWNADRGFGFIAPTQGGREIFVHFSALPRDGTRPAEGETLSFDVGPGRDGKLQAIDVQRQAIGPRQTQPRRPATSKSRNGSAIRTFAKIGFALIMSAYAYRHFALPARQAGQADAASSTGMPAAAAQRIRDDTTSGRRCDGRRFCSQMTSCAEATWFLGHCPDTQMDGDHDGVPCEAQWCTGPLAR